METHNIDRRSMTAENFCYFAQGFFELSGAKSIDEQQVQIFKDHLALVFEKKTPDYQHPFGPTYGGIKLLDSSELLNADPHLFCKDGNLPLPSGTIMSGVTPVMGWTLYDHPFSPPIQRFVTC